MSKASRKRNARIRIATERAQANEMEHALIGRMPIWAQIEDLKKALEAGVSHIPGVRAQDVVVLPGANGVLDITCNLSVPTPANFIAIEIILDDTEAAARAMEAALNPPTMGKALDIAEIHAVMRNTTFDDSKITFVKPEMPK